MKAPQNYKREEGGRVAHKWLVYRLFGQPYIFKHAQKHGIKKKPKSSLEDPAPLYISQG